MKCSTEVQVWRSTADRLKTTLPILLQILNLLSAIFFYRLPSDFYHYRINCNEISYDTVVCLLKKLYNDQENIMQFKEDEYIFFYRQECDNRFYQISCEIVSPLLVNNCLNKK